MSNNYGTDPEKMLDWDKKLGEQSEYVKKAIEPLMTFNFAYIKNNMEEGAFSGNPDYRDYLKTKDKENPNFIKEDVINYFSVGDLYDYLQGYDDDKKPAVEKLITLGIEGERHGDRIDHVFDYEYIKSIDREAYFEEQQRIMFEEEEKEHQLEMDEYFKKSEDENTEQSPISDFEERSSSLRKEMNDYFKIINWDKANEPSFRINLIDEHSQSSQTSGHQLETAQKIGYVQGVCESVLAFNNDENRKIMTEATMTFLSKKLLSEMNVTKDMAQKFANPETYKALEQCVFAPNKEQQLENQHSTERKGKSW